MTPCLYIHIGTEPDSRHTWWLTRDHRCQAAPAQDQHQMSRRPGAQESGPRQGGHGHNLWIVRHSQTSHTTRMAHGRAIHTIGALERYAGAKELKVGARVTPMRLRCSPCNRRRVRRVDGHALEAALRAPALRGGRRMLRGGSCSTVRWRAAALISHPLRLRFGR